MATLFTATVSSHHRVISSSRPSKQNPPFHLVFSQSQPLSVTKQPVVTLQQQPIADFVASPLTRRFGIGAGFSLAGVLAFGIVSEQMKTGLDIYQENPNTRDVEKQEEIVLPNGIRYYDLEVGHGATPSSGHLVVINVKGQVHRTKQVFVDTFKSKDMKPLAMVMDSRPYSKGLCEGVEYILSSMKPGGKRRVIIPPSLGFGEKIVEFGHDSQIPKSATLEYILQVDSVSIV